MSTVGEKIIKLTPQTALVVILATAIVQFLFSSQNLHNFLVNHGLPAIPLVPVSSSQLVIGSLVGIGLVGRGRRNINLKILGKIASGWVMTPVIAALVTFICLFFLQNVFDQRVYRRVSYKINSVVDQRLNEQGISLDIVELEGFYKNAYQFDKVIKPYKFNKTVVDKIFESSEIDIISINNVARFQRKVNTWFTPAEIQSIRALEGQTFQHRWQLIDALQKTDRVWKGRRSETAAFSAARERKLEYLINYFRIVQ
jgi:PiT family inorganic phosphate transporter